MDNDSMHLVLYCIFALVYIAPLANCSGCPFQNIFKRDPPTEEKCAVEVSSCPDTNYRSFDGSCNNLNHPTWGVPLTKYGRLLPPNYGDNISSPTLTKTGATLPNARNVSRIIYSGVKVEDHLWTLNCMQYGQFITHDLSLLRDHTGESLSCCATVGKLSPSCYPIEIPLDDVPFRSHNVSCFGFTRSITDKELNCPGTTASSKAEQLSSVNHYLDLSLVYGNDEQRNTVLRSFKGGKLTSETFNQEEMIPFKDDCYVTGDVRANQNPQLTIIHTIFLREHNRLAGKLAALNPSWDDEKLFQEARKINIAQHQHISYNEWLPIIIGSDNCYDNKLIYKTTDFVNDYNPNVDLSVFNEFSTAAFRFFHTLIAGNLNFVREDRRTSEVTKLSKYWNRAADILNSSFDDLARGLCSQVELAADVYHDDEITLNWLKSPDAPIGQDLKAICIQRNRDHGLASYNDHRVLCGLKKAETFDDFLDVINKSNVDKLASLYEHPDDVELTVGGSLEKILSSTLVGPTFQCIITKQFYNTRVGDRFWYERFGPTGFTLTQLDEIRKSTVSKLICQNDRNIKRIQPRGFEKISPTNVLTACADLPAINLTLWQELPNFL